MKFETSKVLKLKKYYPYAFNDKRGKYIEVFNKKKYFQIFKKNFIEHDTCISKKNVFRGIHGDNHTWKIVSCVYGKCTAYIFNCDRSSLDFGKWEKFYLSSSNYFEILIPPKFGNSFLVTSDIAVYHYKQSRYYSGSKNQFTYNISDPFFNVKLPKQRLIISQRDKKCPFIKI